MAMLKPLFRLLFGVLVCILPHVRGQYDCYNILKPREWYGDEDTFCLWDNNCRTCPSEGDSDYGSDILPFYEDYFVNHTDIPGQVCKLKLEEGYLPHCRYFGFYVQCDVHYCNEHAGCYNAETNGSDYMGLARFTQNGYSCLNWSDVDHGFNETEIELKGNVCRNPDGSEIPWCFYTDQNDNIARDYCPVPACATAVLSGFTRIPDTYPLNPMTMTSYHNLGLLVPDVEEKCAQICVEEENFECRSFFVGPSGFCLVSGAGAIHDGEQVERLKDSGGDLFYRKSTRCNEVIPHKYPDLRSKGESFASDD
nr:uncharacterized protein LOC129267611 [Lytechinus pictus]